MVNHKMLFNKTSQRWAEKLKGFVTLQAIKINPLFKGNGQNQELQSKAKI
jgi:hypothetical protein